MTYNGKESEKENAHTHTQMNHFAVHLRLGFPGNSAGKESACKKKKRIYLQCRRLRFNSWVHKIPWRRDRLPTLVFLSFPGGSDGKESACNAEDLGLIPGLERSLEEGTAAHFSILAWRILIGRRDW